MQFIEVFSFRKKIKSKIGIGMNNLKLYFAPLEGITWYVYRNAHHKIFPGVEKYFAPFIVANQQKEFSAREWNDLSPEHNKEIRLIPQILTNKADDFLCTLGKLETLGYTEVNLNLGCPSGTVVSKNKGAGFLAHPTDLDCFLDSVFSKTKTAISIKTRIGKDDPGEFEQLLKIFNQYPIEELIIHPRIQKDFYQNTPNKAIFREAVKKSKNPVVYNGDLLTPDDLHAFTDEFETIDRVMIGRGLIRNPGLEQEYSKQKETDLAVLQEFHDQIYTEYKTLLSGDRNVLFRMKEIWFYLMEAFPDQRKNFKKIRKSQSCREYEEIISLIFES